MIDHSKILNPTIKQEYVQSFNNYMLDILYPGAVMARNLLSEEENE